MRNTMRSNEIWSTCCEVKFIIPGPEYWSGRAVKSMTRVTTEVSHSCLKWSASHRHDDYRLVLNKPKPWCWISQGSVSRSLFDRLWAQLQKAFRRNTWQAEKHVRCVQRRLQQRRTRAQLWNTMKVYQLLIVIIILLILIRCGYTVDCEKHEPTLPSAGQTVTPFKVLITSYLVLLLIVFVWLSLCWFSFHWNASLYFTLFILWQTCLWF